MRLSSLVLGFIVLVMYTVDAHAIRRALVVGLGEQLDKRWSKIHGDNDIHFVVNMLQDMGYTDIRTLRNEQATKAAMKQAFEDLMNKCVKGDNVYIHYSGHGQLMTDLDGDESLKWNGEHSQWDESWIPYDAYMYYCKEDKGDKHFCDDEVAVFLQSIRNKIGKRGTLTVVVDACHSGDATCGDDNSECIRGVDVKFNIPKSIQSATTPPMEEEWLTISACKPYQLCSEIKQPQVGKLTYALYTLGMRVQGLTNQQLENLLTIEFEKYRGRIKQHPMVTGKK